MDANPHLQFPGNCEEAFTFYAQALGGKIEAMITAEGTPMASHVPPERLKKIMHARLKVGEGTIMGADAPPEHYKQPQGFTVTLMVKTAEEADRLFNALAKGGQIGMPIQKTFWAVRFGMVTDKFGIPWMVNCEAAA